MQSFLRLTFFFALLSACSGLANGYRTRLGSAPDDFPVVVVTGTRREMGFALGSLMKPEIQAFVPAFLKAAQNHRPDLLGDAALDQGWSTMEPFISARFKEELAGLAEGAGLPYDLIRRV